MNWKDFMPLLVVETNEVHQLDNYICDKGVYLHKQIYDLILTVDSEVKYAFIAKLLRYDKGIRNVLYKYLSAFEEKNRAILFDKYDVENKIVNPEKARIEKLNLVPRSSNNSNLYNISYSRYFNLTVLTKTMMELNLIDIDTYIDYEEITKLRNKTMHHNLLMTSYHSDFENVNKEISKIENWIELLYKYLPEGMNTEFEKAINRCNNLGTKMNVPNLEIVCLKEMTNGVFI